MNNFKSAQGKWITKSLFYELTFQTPERPHAIYTLADEDIVKKGRVYRSLKKMYLACEDPTEYEFANKHLGGWLHWKAMQETIDLKVPIAEWREEYSVSLRSKGVKKIIDIATGKDPSYQAAKWLADKQWIETKAGRPTKSQINQAAKEKAQVKDRISSDITKLEEYKNAKKK